MDRHEEAGAVSGETTSAGVRPRARTRQGQTSLQRTLPASPEAERAVIAALLLEPRHLQKVLTLIDEHAFTEPHYAAIFRAMRTLQDEGEGVDVVAVCGQLRNARLLDKIGGPHFVSQLLASAITAEGVHQHAAIVRKSELQRQQIALAERALARAYDPTDYEAGLETLADEIGALRLAHIATSDQEIQSWTFDDAKQIVGSIEWIWPSWIPMGFVTLLIGKPEIGKSKFALRLAASALDPALPWPDGVVASNRNGSSCKVGWIEAESGHAMNVNRAADLGLPGDRFIWPRLPNQDPLDEISLSNPKVLSWIERWAIQTKPALIIVDSLRGTMKGNENDSEHVMIVQRLGYLAAKLHCGLVLIHHPGKAKEGRPFDELDMERVRGSTAIVQFCRSIIALDKLDRGIGNVVRCHVIKSNLGPRPEPLGLEHDGPGWRVVDAPVAQRSETIVDVVGDLLLGILASGPRYVTELQTEIEDAGHSWAAARRAQKALGIVAVRQASSGAKRGAGRWVWSLPADRAPSLPGLDERDAERADAGATALEQSGEAWTPDPFDDANTAPVSPHEPVQILHEQEDNRTEWWER